MIEPKSLITEFNQRFFRSGEGLIAFFSPGRVNLIGEHIDYNGGLVMPMAIDLGITALVKFRTDSLIRIQSTDGEGEFLVNFSKQLPNELDFSWMQYPLGVIHHLSDMNALFQGADILLSSDLPMGSGLSSSASMEVLITKILLNGSQNELLLDGSKLALFCQKVENDFVGVKCGIMDQFAVANGKENNAVVLNCNTLQFEYIPFQLEGVDLLILNTNKKRKLTDSKYNQRKASCDRALEILQSHRPLDCLVKAELTSLSLLGDSILEKRVRHVVSEEKRVRAAVGRLRRNDAIGFGKLLWESHESLRHDYEVTGFELDTIVDLAMESEACLGARMTGAGFGGCAIALVKSEKTKEFTEYLKTHYFSRTKLELGIFRTSASASARMINRDN